MNNYEMMDDNLIVCKSSKLIKCTRCEKMKADILVIQGSEMIAMCKGCGKIIASRILLHVGG